MCGYRRDRVTRVAFWSVYGDSPIIAVRGEAVLEIEPEVARIEVSIAARGPDRAAAITALTDRDADVSLILGDFDEIIEKSESSGVRLSPPQVSQNGESSGHGVIHHAVTVVSFDRLAELMGQLAADDLTEAGGPWWDLRPASAGADQRVEPVAAPAAGRRRRGSRA